MNLKSTIAIVFFTMITISLNAQKNGAIKKPMPKQAASASQKKSENHDREGISGKSDLKTEQDSLSYAIGMNIGQSLKQQGLDNLNLELLKGAMNDVLKGKATTLTSEQCMPVIMSTMKKAQEKKFAPVKAEGEKYLTENKKKEGVIVLPSGLQYQIITKGTGEIPKATDKVNVHYHGTLLDGKVFDSSVDRGAPATFGVTQVIAGWVEALQLMPVGSKWKLFIPSALAYGERGAGENIPPFSTLIFDVELLSIEKAPVENK